MLCRLAAFCLCVVLCAAAREPSAAQGLPAQTVNPAGAGQPATAPAASDAAVQGPMRVELHAIYENRRKFWEIIGTKHPSVIHVLMRLRGDRLREIVRLGGPIIEEFVDDTGKVLFDPTGYKPRQLDATRVYQVKDVDLQYGVELRASGHIPNRDAHKISRLRGYVNVVYGSEPVLLTFPDATRNLGKTLEHPLIDELHIPLKMRMLRPRDARVPVDSASFIIAYDQGRENVRDVYVYDAWLRSIKAQPSPATTPDGQEVVVYRLMRGDFNADCELVFVVYPYVEKERVPIELYDIELP